MSELSVEELIKQLDVKYINNAEAVKQRNPTVDVETQA
jgi:hypothetical protein